MGKMEKFSEKQTDMRFNNCDDEVRCELCETDHRDEDGSLTPCFDSIIGTVAVGVMCE